MVVVVVVVGVGDRWSEATRIPYPTDTQAVRRVQSMLFCIPTGYIEERQLPSRRRQHQHRRSSVKPAPIRLLAVPGRASLWHVQQHREGNPSRPVSSRSSHRFNWCLRLAGRPPPDLGVGFCPSDKTRRAMSLRRLSRTCRLIAYNVLARVCVHNNYTLHDACRCRCRLRFSEGRRMGPGHGAELLRHDPCDSLRS